MTITLIAGDTRPIKLVYEIERVAADITGYQFVLVIEYDTPLEVPGEIIDAATGLFAFPWAEGDLIAGSYPFRIRETDAAGTRKTHKMGTLEILA
jgi:hypothetical protein